VRKKKNHDIMISIHESDSVTARVRAPPGPESIRVVVLIRGHQWRLDLFAFRVIGWPADSEKPFKLKTRNGKVGSST
jgi:hypothetical protein